MNNDENNQKRVDPAIENLTRAGLNAVTGGKYEAIRKIPGVGNLAKGAEQKIANKIGNNRLASKIADPLQHKRPNLGVPTKNESQPEVSNDSNKSHKNNSQSKDVGLRNLQNSLAKKALNLWQNRKKKTEKNASEANSDNSNNDSSSNNTNGNNTSEDDNSLSLDSIISMKRKLRKIKIAIFVGVAGFALLFSAAVIIIIYNVVTGNSISSIPLVSANLFGTDNFVSFYRKDSDENKEEINYYQKLEEVSKNYSKNHVDKLKISYIHSILMYIYYSPVDTTEESNLPDFKKMNGMVDKIVELMNFNNTVDYEKNGEFYNNLKNSSAIRDYYSKLMVGKDDSYIDTILNGVFDLANALGDIEFRDNTTITTETKVTVTEKKDTGNNSSKQQTTKTITINEYLADSIYAKSTDLSNSEITKAYTVGYSTNLAAQNKKLSIDSNNANASNNTCSVTKGCSYDKNGNLIAGAGSQSSKNTNFYNGKYYYKRPLTEEEINNLNKDINSVFGNVLVNSDGTYPELDIDKINGLGDGDYKSILTKGYGKLEYKNIGENSYILDGSYGTKKVLTNVTFYDQNDYSEYNFCGKKKETIKSSGCGVTAMAMIVSTYEKDTKKYTPVDMMKAARSGGYCGGGISGTSPGFFKKEASTMKYKYYYASKYNKYDLNLILKHLSQGDLVIAHMLAGHFTSGGHYMVLGGVDPETKKVYVYDPYNKVNKSYRKTGNGWYSFNDLIVKEAKAFYIVWKG